MGRVYAVASAKGGVGKTTTTANLGVALAEGGASAVVVDADLGMPNLGRSLGVDGVPTVHDALAGTADATAIVHDGVGDVAVVPGAADIDAFRTADPAGLVDLVDALADQYDHVVVDTGAGLSHDNVVPLSAADEVVLVTDPSRDARGDTTKTREIVDRLGTPIAGVVLTRGDDDADAERFDDLTVLGVVPESEAVTAGTEAGEPVVLSDPDDPAAVAYRRVAAALTGGDGPTVVDTDDGAVATGTGVDTAESDGEDGFEVNIDEADATETDDDAGGLDDDEEANVPESDDGEDAGVPKSDDDEDGDVPESDDVDPIDDLVDEAEPTDDEVTSDGAAADDSGVHETALFSSRDDDPATESESDDDSADTDKKKGFFSRLLGLD
jgi:septum site-determining protein MinD